MRGIADRGYFHLEIAKVQTSEGELSLFVAIDRMSRFAFARFRPRAGKMEAVQVLRGPVAAVPKDATVKRFHDGDRAQLRRHLAGFLDAYNFARRLKTPRSLTPCEFIGRQWTAEPERFTLKPIQQMPGLNT